MTALNVYFRETACGQLSEDSQGRLEFRYLGSWLEQGRVPVSLTLPLAESVYGHDRVAPFVANLLPEGGDLRARLERLLHVDAGHDFGLLAATGRESAGALSFWPEEESPRDFKPRYAALDLGEFHRWRDAPGRLPFQLHGRPLRLSLAGVQQKVALFFDSADVPYVPIDGAPTTHILKPRLPGCRPSTVYAELAAMSLARAVLGEGEVPEVDVWEHCYRIRRFDRPRSEGQLTRLHQEDFCLALGRMPAGKYESTKPREGLLASCFELIDRLGVQGLVRAPAVERQRLLHQVIFNVLVHNPDAHLKNYALLYHEDGTLGVAPLYDALSTQGMLFGEESAAWGGGRGPEVHTTELSLRIGQAHDIFRVSLDDWSVFAAECGFTAAFVRRRVRELAEQTRAALPGVSERLVEAHPHAEAALGLLAEALRR